MCSSIYYIPLKCKDVDSNEILDISKFESFNIGINLYNVLNHESHQKYEHQYLKNGIYYLVITGAGEFPTYLIQNDGKIIKHEIIEWSEPINRFNH
jgi:hypothetical protein